MQPGGVTAARASQQQCARTKSPRQGDQGAYRQSQRTPRLKAQCTQRLARTFRVCLQASPGRSGLQASPSVWRNQYTPSLPPGVPPSSRQSPLAHAWTMPMPQLRRQSPPSSLPTEPTDQGAWAEWCRYLPIPQARSAWVADQATPPWNHPATDQTRCACLARPWWVLGLRLETVLAHDGCYMPAPRRSD